MAVQSGQNITLGYFPAGVDLSQTPNIFVVINASRQVVKQALNALTPGVTGVLDGTPFLNQAAAVIIEGTAKVLVGAGGVTAGLPVTSDANGNAIAVTAGTSLICGIALETGVVGQIVEVALSASLLKA